MTFRRLSQGGDTIVEVLLAMAIVSLVLGAAFASTNQSLARARNSQERGEVLKLLEGQIELIKAADIAAVNNVCLFVDGGGNIRTAASSDARCSQNAEGQPNPDPGSAYNIDVDYSADTYVVSARWSRLGAGTDQEMRLFYRRIR